MTSVWNHKNFPVFSDTALILGPEHAKTFAQDGWSKNDIRQFLLREDPPPVPRTPAWGQRRRGRRRQHAQRGQRDKQPPADDTLYPKFPKPESILILVAGGTAGRFSAAVPGLVRGSSGSTITTKEIQPA